MLISLLAASMSIGPNQFAEAVNPFGMNVLQRMVAEEGSGNVLVSPLSLGTALAMAAEGADGVTWREMAETLNFSAIGRDEMNKSASALLALLSQADESTRMEIANALWANQAFKFEPAYVQSLQSMYGAEARTLDFSAPASVPTMNAWVAEKTHGKITQIVSDLPSDSLMVLMNAVSFKGDWVDPFEPTSNTKKPFDGVGESTYMRKLQQWSYVQDDQAQFVRLPYGNGRFSMEIALPAPGAKIADFTAGLSSESWAKWSRAAAPSYGMVTLPKWKSETSIELSRILKSMGMKSAFAPGADFTRMIKGPPAFIGLVNHKTFIEVDEKGTEAAAVTSIQFRAGSSLPPKERFDFDANRPFVYAITESESGAMLFLGVVRNPN